MTPTQLALHEAHKARQQRFAMAAMRSSAPVMSAPVNVEATLVPPVETRCRRSYETKKRLPDYMPIAVRVIKTVAHEFGMPVEALTGPKRRKELCIARFVAIGILSEMTQMSLPAMGRRFGGRDHTTIINAQRRAEKLFAEEAFRNRVDQIKAELSV